MLKMDSINFAYWLQGLFELGKVKSLTSDQVKIIKNHADLVLKTIEIDEAKKPKQYIAKPGLPQKTIPHGDRRYLC